MAGYQRDQAIKPMLYQAFALPGSAATTFSYQACASSHLFRFRLSDASEDIASWLPRSNSNTFKNSWFAAAEATRFSGDSAPGIYCCIQAVPRYKCAVAFEGSLCTARWKAATAREESPDLK